MMGESTNEGGLMNRCVHCWRCVIFAREEIECRREMCEIQVVMAAVVRRGERD